MLNTTKFGRAFVVTKYPPISSKLPYCHSFFYTHLLFVIRLQVCLRLSARSVSFTWTSIDINTSSDVSHQSSIHKKKCLHARIETCGAMRVFQRTKHLHTHQRDKQRNLETELNCDKGWHKVCTKHECFGVSYQQYRTKKHLKHVFPRA